MKNKIIIKSKNGNYYYANSINKIIQLIHPELAKSYFSESKNKKLSYYDKKKQYLEKHLQINNIDNQYEVNIITEKDIENSITTTSQLIFEVTDKCNLNCKYCGYGELYNNYDKRNTKDASIEDAKALIDYYFKLCRKKNYTNKNLIIGFYGGEPLLNMNFIKSVINYIENKYKGIYKYHITTNGLLLKKNIDYIIEKKINLLISLDGDENSNSYRVFNNNAPSYNYVIDNIKYIKENFPDYYLSYVNFSSVLHDRNNIQNIVGFFKNIFFKSPAFGRLNDGGINPLKKEEFKSISQNDSQFDYQNLETDELLEKVFLIAGHVRFLHNSLFSIYNTYLDLISNNHHNQKIYPTATCFPFSKKIFITVNGKVFPCEKIGHTHCLGEIKNGEVNISYTNIADKYNHLYMNMYNILCSSCSLIKSCITCGIQSNGTCKMKKNKLIIFNQK